MSNQTVEEFTVRVAHLAIIPLIVFVDHLIEQEWNIFLALFERRQAKMRDIETIKKIHAELPGFDQCFQWLVSCGNDTDIDRHRAVAANWHDLMGFQYAQQLGLRVQTHFADFIQ